MEVTSSNNKVAIEVKTTDSFFCPICMECVPLVYTVKWTSCKHMYFFIIYIIGAVEIVYLHMPLHQLIVV